LGSTRTGAGKTEYQNDPTNTITAPAASCAFQPLPNHHTLKHKLIALRVVSTTFVFFSDTLYRKTIYREEVVRFLGVPAGWLLVLVLVLSVALVIGVIFVVTLRRRASVPR